MAQIIRLVRVLLTGRGKMKRQTVRRVSYKAYFLPLSLVLSFIISNYTHIHTPPPLSSICSWIELPLTLISIGKSIGSGSIRQNRRILYPPLVQSPVSTEPTPSYIHLLPTSTTTPSSSSFSRRTSLTRVNTIDKMDQPGSQNDDELFAAFLDPTFLDAYTMPMPPIIGSPSFPGLPPTSLALSAQVGVPTSSQTNHMPIASAPTLAIRPPSFNYSLTSIHPPSTSNTVGMRSSSLYKSSALFNAQQNSPYYPTGANQATPDYAVATAQPHLPSSNSVSTSDLQTYTKSSTISTSSQMNGYSSHQSQCPNLNPLPTGWNASADTSAWRGVRGISGISDAYLVALETADQRSGYHVPPSFEELAAINQHLDPVYSPRLVHRAPSFTQLPQTVPQSIDLFQATHPSDKPHRPVFDSELIPLGYPARPAEPFDTNSGEAKDGIDGKGSMVHCFKPAAAPLTTSLTTKRPIKASRQTLHVELDEDDDGYGGDSAGLEKQDCDCESLATFSDVCAMAFGTSQVNAYDLTSPSGTYLFVVELTYSDLEAIRDASASQRPYHFRTRRLPSAGQAAPIPHSGPDKPFLEVAVSKGTSPNAYTGRNTYKTTSAAILDVPLTIPPYRPIRTLDEYYTYALRPLTPETLYDIPVMDQRIMILAPRSGSHLFPEEKIAQ